MSVFRPRLNTRRMTYTFSILFAPKMGTPQLTIYAILAPIRICSNSYTYSLVLVSTHEKPSGTTTCCGLHLQEVLYRVDREVSILCQPQRHSAYALLTEISRQAAVTILVHKISSFSPLPLFDGGISRMDA